MTHVKTGVELLDPVKILHALDIRQGMHVADFGCGTTGHFTFPAAKLIGPDGVVYAVDILRETLKILEKRANQDRYTNIKYIWSDIEVYRATRIEDNSLDIGLLVNVLFSIPDRTNIAKELARMIKRGGKLVIIDWAKEANILGPSPERRISSQEVKKIFDIPEFRLADTLQAGRAHYELVFEKV